MFVSRSGYQAGTEPEFVKANDMFHRTEDKQDSRIYTLSREKPARAVLKMSVPLIAGMFVMVLYGVLAPCLVGIFTDSAEVIETGAKVLRRLMNRLFAFDGMLWAQPVTEAVMMFASLFLILRVISKQVQAGG